MITLNVLASETLEHQSPARVAADTHGFLHAASAVAQPKQN